MDLEVAGEICLGAEYGWQRFELSENLIYFKGYLNGYVHTNAAAAHAAEALIKASEGRPKSFEALDGHYALVVETPRMIIAAVDRVRSTPLIWSILSGGNFIVGDHASPFIEHLCCEKKDIDVDGVQDLAIAGYVLGRSTIYRSVKALLPGEFAVFSKTGGKPVIQRYATYRPWQVRVDSQTASQWRKELRDLTLGVLQKMIDRAQGRQLLLPLSAGLDSRLIASGLKHLGYTNVQCFSYGRPGNHEAYAAEKIASALGYRWHFLPSISSEVRRHRQGADFKRFLTLADNLTATPVEQDVFTVMSLRGQHWVESDAIIVNGQSGDFISGNHIPAILSGNIPKSRQVRDQKIFTAMTHKHFDLWTDLKTPENLERIKSRLWREFEEIGAPVDQPDQAFALYEFFDFQNRQAKYVLGNQRSYEVFGWDWHLPLWDIDYLDFWETVPLEMKYDQQLYREMLVEANWGGVWKSLLPAPRWIVPKAIRPLRHLAHLLCLPFGNDAWSAVDKRFFNHITDPLRKYAAVSYWQVATGPAHRNVVSWLTALYLERHGLSRDGSSQ